jgi:hypothetical protein
MLRRSFLTGITSAALGLGTRRLAGAPEPESLRISIDVATAGGLHIAPDFIGLSYDSAILADEDYVSSYNTSLIGLIRRLGPTGVLRIGGNTSEDTIWKPSNQDMRLGRIVLTPARIDRLAALVHALGWKLIYGLNLARGTPEAAAAEAAYVARALGTDLLAFQIGNEPDGFGRWRSVRAKSYDARAYLAEWRGFHQASRAQVPDARFAGPDVAMETGWVDALAADHPAGLMLLTRHYYADGPAGAPQLSVAKLLQSEQQIVPVLDTLARASRAYGLPVRIVEANSIYNEGQPGVSDTLGAALWGLELMFQLAVAGAAGINFHAGPHNLRPELDKAYTPIARAGGGNYRPATLYYAMLLFTQLAPGGTVLPVRMSRPGEVAALAVRASDGSLRIGLINKNLARGVRIAVDAGREFAGASILRLAGPSSQATSGVTFGAAQVDAHGQWNPRAERVPVVDRVIALDLPPASAALLTFTIQ